MRLRPQRPHAGRPPSSTVVPTERWCSRSGPPSMASSGAYCRRDLCSESAGSLGPGRGRQLVRCRGSVRCRGPCRGSSPPSPAPADGQQRAAPALPAPREAIDTATAAESRDTKLCRSSRGVQAAGSRPAAATMRRNARRTLCASSSVPLRVPKTSASPSGRLPEAGAVRGEGVDAAAGDRDAASRLAGLGVAALPDRAQHGDRRRDRGSACGLPTRSTCSQRSARTSSVRAPVSRESTT